MRDSKTTSQPSINIAKQMLWLRSGRGCPQLGQRSACNDDSFRLDNLVERTRKTCAADMQGQSHFFC